MAETTAAIAAAALAFDNSHGNSRPLPPPNALEEPSHNENFQAEVLNDKKKKKTLWFWGVVGGGGEAAGV